MDAKRMLMMTTASIAVMSAFAQDQVIKGLVVSVDGNEPLVGATVYVKGKESHGVVTDVDGNFTVTVGENEKALTFSYIGMKSRDVKIGAGTGNINVKLESETMNLDEVVVTGYGNFTKSSFTGSANTIKADIVKNVPVLSVEQKLQGMTSGVSITNSSGQPGANQNIRIRGMGSFNASKEPLFVVDGVPVTSGSMSAGSSADPSYMNNAKTSIMSTINPADIENITVIKDAAAASLYGSRAANGVILITTKQGSSGRTNVVLRANAGFSDFAVDFRPTLNGEDRRTLIYEGLVNRAIYEGIESPQGYADANIDLYASKPESGYTDWRDELFRKGTQQSYEVAVSGGNNRTTFYSSLGYNNQQGLVANSNLDRYSARLNVGHKIGTRAEVGANMMFSQINQEMNEERGSSINPFFCAAVTMTPSMVVRDEDGNYTGCEPGSNLNPVRDINTDINLSKITRIFNTGHAMVEIIKGLRLKEQLSYDYTIQKDTRYLNPLSGAGVKSGSDAQSSKGFVEYGKLISSTSVNYIRDFGYDHHLDVLAAYEIEDYQTDKASGEKSNLPSEELTEVDNAAVLNSFISSTTASRMLSYVSRLNYDYANKYYLAGSFRRDGSSRLSSSNRWGNFWSVSSMWHLSKESFMNTLKPVLSDVKIRASYGVNGNQPGSFYGYMGLYSYGQNYMGAAGSYETTLANDNLKWEKNYNMNIGLDLAFIERIFLSVEYYNRDTKDLLYNRPTSATTGFLNYLANIGELNNKGVEVELRTLNFSNKDFEWTSVLNMTHNRNKIVSLDGSMQQTIEGTWFIRKVGHSFNTFYVKEFAGVDPDNGSALYYLNTVKEDGSLDRSTTDNASLAQAIAYKSADAGISGGFTNLLRYKWFDLGATFTYSFGGYSFDKTGSYIETDGANESKRNLPVYAMDRWQNPGDITNVPRFVLNQPAGPSNSSRYVHSTDHIRLKSLTVGATIPSEWLQKLMIQNARVYFSGSNLFTWAKWDQYDPEVPVTGEVYCEAPQMKTFSFGIEVTF